jgi:PhnB protein
MALLTASVLIISGCSPHDSVGSSPGDKPLDNATSNASANKGLTMKLSPYLLFDGRCQQAMEFYRSVFGGELTLTTVGQSPMKDAFPDHLHSRVVNARLKSSLVDISASDWLHPTEKPIRGNTVCLYLSGGTPEVTTTLFRRLSENADVTDTLSEQPFGLYGALNDRFGVRWMFHAEKQ